METRTLENVAKIMRRSMTAIRPYFIAAILTAAVTASAAAQYAADDRYGGTTGTIPPVASGKPGGVPDWSGESGASGHPLMTADAIRAGAANFHVCLERLWPVAARRNISRGFFQAVTA